MEVFSRFFSKKVNNSKKAAGSKKVNNSKKVENSKNVNKNTKAAQRRAGDNGTYFSVHKRPGAKFEAGDFVSTIRKGVNNIERRYTGEVYLLGRIRSGQQYYYVDFLQNVKNNLRVSLPENQLTLVEKYVPVPIDPVGRAPPPKFPHAVARPGAKFESGDTVSTIQEATNHIERSYTGKVYSVGLTKSGMHDYLVFIKNRYYVLPENQLKLVEKYRPGPTDGLVSPPPKSNDLPHEVARPGAKFEVGDKVDALYGDINGKGTNDYTPDNVKKIRGVGTILEVILRNKNTDVQYYKVLVNGVEYDLPEKQLNPIKKPRGGSRRKRVSKRRRTHRR